MYMVLYSYNAAHAIVLAILFNMLNNLATYVTCQVQHLSKTVIRINPMRKSIINIQRCRFNSTIPATIVTNRSKKELQDLVFIYFCVTAN